VQPLDGKILLGGEFTARKLSNGADDPTTRNYLARLNTDGSLDATFNPNPNGAILTLIARSDGMILVAGGFTAVQPNGATTATARNYLARLKADGTVDGNFDPHPNAGVMTMAAQSDGKILVGGYFSTFQPNGADTVNHPYLARINQDGTVDGGFANANTNSKVMAVAVQPDGKVLIGGSFSSSSPGAIFSNASHAFVVRLNADGTLDDAFNPSPNYLVDSITVQADGKILIAAISPS